MMFFISGVIFTCIATPVLLRRSGYNHRLYCCVDKIKDIPNETHTLYDVKIRKTSTKVRTAGTTEVVRVRSGPAVRTTVRPTVFCRYGRSFFRFGYVSPRKLGKRNLLIVPTICIISLCPGFSQLRGWPASIL